MVVSPTIKFKVLVFQYERILKDIHAFKERSGEIDFFLGKVRFQFYEPEF